VNWADLMAAQGAFGTDFYDRLILRLKHRAYYRSSRPVLKIGPKGALGSHEIRRIHSAPSLGLSIVFIASFVFRCPNTHFRCAYGACVMGSLTCDGLKACADGSDEYAPACSNTGPDPVAQLPPRPRPNPPSG